MTEERLLAPPYNFPGGLAMRLAKEAKALKEKPKPPFSSYKSLSVVLKNYGIDGNGIGTIRQFPPSKFLAQIFLTLAGEKLTYFHPVSKKLIRSKTKTRSCNNV